MFIAHSLCEGATLFSFAGENRRSVRSGVSRPWRIDRPDPKPPTLPGGWNPAPPIHVAPRGHRPEIITDCHRVLLADPAGNIIGLYDGQWWQGGPPGKLVYASRETSRAF